MDPSLKWSMQSVMIKGDTDGAIRKPDYYVYVYIQWGMVSDFNMKFLTTHPLDFHNIAHGCVMIL